MSSDAGHVHCGQVFIASGSANQTCRLLTERAQCSSCKRQKQYGSSSTALQPARARSLSPYLRRVGGGYEYTYPQIEYPSSMPARTPQLTAPGWRGPEALRVLLPRSAGAQRLRCWRTATGTMTCRSCRRSSSRLRRTQQTAAGTRYRAQAFQGNHTGVPNT